MARVLVVDDDAVMGELCRDILTEDGHQVVCTCRGKPLVDLMQRQRFDVVLLDPGRKKCTVGLLLRIIQPVSLYCPWIVLHSDIPKIRLKKIAGRMGIQAYLSRGGSVAELRSAVRAAARHRPWPSRPTPAPADRRWSRAFDVTGPVSIQASASWF